MSAHILPRLLVDTCTFDVRVSHHLRALRTFVRESACVACGGHAYLLHASRDRLCLRCHECGHETPGWRIDARQDRRTCASRVQPAAES